jgi:glycosyltransferase involved in cell wall biosynthesis
MGRRGLHLHVIDELKIGGAQTHLLTILREAVVRYPYGHRVVTLFGDGPIGDDIRALGIPVDVFDFRPLLQQRRFFRAVGALERLFRQYRPSLVEAHLTWSRLLGLYAAWRAGILLRIGFEQGDLYMNSWKMRAANFLGQCCAHRIIVCSQALGDWAHRTHGISRNRLAVLHNCVDIQRFRPLRNPELRASWRLAGDPVIFAAVGTLGTGVNKRVDVLIRAIAEARRQDADVALVICGDGSQRADLERLTDDLGIRDSVRFLGMRPDVSDTLAACDAFCHAAPFEPFGIVCIEAMAMGLPVVVPNSGGIRETVEDGETGFAYPALDHSELARLMVRLHNYPEGRYAMGAQARRTVEQRFSVEAYLGRLYDVYGLQERSAEAARA